MIKIQRPSVKQDISNHIISKFYSLEDIIQIEALVEPIGKNYTETRTVKLYHKRPAGTSTYKVFIKSGPYTKPSILEIYLKTSKS